MWRWIALISGIVLLVAIAGIVVSSQPSISPTQQQTREDHDKKHDEQKNNKTLWDRWFPDSISIYTLFLVVFTAVLAGVGVIQLNLLNRAERIASDTAKAAKNSADTAQGQLAVMANAQRPWMAILGNAPPAVSPLIFDEASKGGVLAIRFTIRNIGNVPAFNVLVKAGPYIVEDARNQQEDISKFCAQTKQESLTDPMQQQTVIFPNEGGPIETRIVFPQADIDAQMKEAGNFFNLFVLFCIAYRTPDQKDVIHATGSTYMIIVRDPQTGQARGFNAADKVVPQNNILISRSITYAD